MHTAWLSLGSNEGDREAHLREATRYLTENPQSTISRVSSLYETPPWGDLAQGAYLNAVLTLQTTLSDLGLLDFLQAIEQRMGRRRDPERPWGPRIIDLDILLIDQQVIEAPRLQVPHPRLHERAFVLVPLLELEPDLQIPGLGAADEHLSRCTREGIVRRSGPAWAFAP